MLELSADYNNEKQHKFLTADNWVHSTYLQIMLAEKKTIKGLFKASIGLTILAML